MSEENQPHDSAYVYSSRKGKHWYKVAPSLREKDRSRGQWILLGLLVVFAVVGGSFLGFTVQTTILNPPTQVVGVCPPPAFIQGNDCLQNVTTTDSQGNVHTSVQPAGSLTAGVSCKGNICSSGGGH